MDISIKPTAWNIGDRQTALTSSLVLQPSQCLLQRLMVRDAVKMDSAVLQLIKSLLSLPREIFLRVFPAQDWQTVGPTQLDTRYRLVCVTVYMCLCPNTQAHDCCPAGLKSRLECSPGIIYHTHTHTLAVLCCYWRARWAWLCFW